MEQTNNSKTLIDKYAHLFKGFAPMDDVEKGITSIISSTSGMIDIDATDVECTLEGCKEADVIISFCQPEEISEIITAQKMVLDSKHPNLNARSLLFQFCINPETELKMYHMNAVTEFFSQLDPDINVIWGLARNNEVPRDEVEIIVLAGY